MLNPITAKRLKRFRKHRRAFFSLIFLFVLYCLSLAAELLCNGEPLLLRHEGRWYFPVLKFYPDDAFTGSGLNTRADYRKIARDNPGDFMIWPLLSQFGPSDIVSAEDLSRHLRIVCRLQPLARVCGLSVGRDLSIRRFQADEAFAQGNGLNWQGKRLDECWQVPEGLASAIERRFSNVDAEAFEAVVQGKDGLPEVKVMLAKYKARTAVPKQVRMTAQVLGDASDNHRWLFAKDGLAKPLNDNGGFQALPDEVKDGLRGALSRCLEEKRAVSGKVQIQGAPYQYSVEAESVRFPFRPVPGHLCGLDDAGRDVFVRLLYAIRISLTFGLILVFCSMFVGSFIGLVQGYAGGWLDLGGQRLIEIWSALPFLYIVVLMGSIYGPGFWLMIFCYALFNWIGISYYMRAEMLRLKKQTFVEAAKCLGLSPLRIILRHILPNALVPIITFFPFSLVGAIASLAALDYLGFGLPPQTPSIGQLLQQAQSLRWAWWLILYPSLTLFVVMLLGVFIGEGVRDAFDPRGGK